MHLRPPPSTGTSVNDYTQHFKTTHDYSEAWRNSNDGQSIHALTHKTNDAFEDATCKMAGRAIIDGPIRAEPMANVLQTDRAALEGGSRVECDGMLHTEALVYSTHSWMRIAARASSMHRNQKASLLIRKAIKTRTLRDSLKTYLRLRLNRKSRTCGRGHEDGRFPIPSRLG